MFFLLAPLAAVLGPHQAEAQVKTAALVRDKIDEVFAILRDPSLRGSANRQQRHQKILAVANTIFDWAEMSRRSLGVHWRRISSTEQERFVTLFREVLANYYLEQMDNFAGNEKITVHGSAGGRNVQVVMTTLITQSRERMPINYYLEKGPHGWRVFDVSIEGISLVNNYRGRFRQYLVNHSFDKLLAHLSGVVGKANASDQAGAGSND